MNPLRDIRFLAIVIVVMVGLWMMITPWYDAVMEFFQLNPIASFIIGAVIVLVGIKYFRLHPW